MGTSKHKSQVLLYLPDALRRKLKSRSTREGKAMSRLVAEALSQKEQVISEVDIQEAVDAMLKKSGERPKLVILFGSYARGRQKRNSDVDLMVVFKGKFSDWKEEENKYDNLREALNLPVPCDLLVTDEEHYTDWKDAFGCVYYDAAHEGKVIYAEN